MVKSESRLQNSSYLYLLSTLKSNQYLSILTPAFGTDHCDVYNIDKLIYHIKDLFAQFAEPSVRHSGTIESKLSAHRSKEASNTYMKFTVPQNQLNQVESSIHRRRKPTNLHLHQLWHSTLTGATQIHSTAIRCLGS